MPMVGTCSTSTRKGDAIARSRGHTSGMTSAAESLALSRSLWRVSRDGVAVAVVALQRESSGIIVAADLATSPVTVGPHRFDTLQAAEAFVGDLIASFAYLGCDIAAA